MPPGWTLIPATALASLAGVIAATQGSGVIIAAIIAGSFMLVNSLLTIWLTNRLLRGRRDEDSRPRNRKR